MNRNGIIHPEVRKAISAIGHTQFFVIADAGLPIPDTVSNSIDISFTKGIPDFISVLTAVLDELVVESYIYAEETEAMNTKVYQYLCEALTDVPSEKVSHSDFKKLVENAYVVLRTGECSSFSNVILVAGVDF